VVERSKADDDRSSPRRIWPQKASNAQAATAASIGFVRSSPSKRSCNMATVIGGRGGFGGRGGQVLGAVDDYL
jgi:hypothetical protein